MPLRSFLPALTIGNTGNLGLPLCLFAFGEEGSASRSRSTSRTRLVQFTLVPLLQARASVLRTLFTTPVIYAPSAGWACSSSGVALPDWFDDDDSRCSAIC